MLRSELRPLLLAVAMAALVTLGACGLGALEAVTVGHHELRLRVPAGWERLDHGRQQLFRRGEARLSIEDLGPVGREAIVRELNAARDLWRSGRQRDAFARVAELRVPDPLLSDPDRRHEFWMPWGEALDSAPGYDSAIVERSFDGLIGNANALPNASLEELCTYAMRGEGDADRRELGRTEHVSIGGRAFVRGVSWDRVSHADPRPVAWCEDRGYLLEVSALRGTTEQIDSAFESLLRSIVIVPPPGS